MDSNTFLSTLIAIAFVYGIWILNRMIIGRKTSILGYFRGQDGRASTSKFQFFVFTFAFVFSFVLMHTYCWFVAKHFILIDTIPPNVMLAMGFSCVTFVGAKAITTTQISSGKLDKGAIPAPPAGDVAAAAPPVPGSAPTKDSWIFLVSDDNGDLDLSKFQMLIWTLIAVIIFIINAYQIIDYIHVMGGKKFLDTYDPNAAHAYQLLPDISGALMVLMGLGQGAYLGKKLVLAPVPRLTGLSVATPPPDGKVTPVVIQIMGGDFGDKLGNQILIDGMPVPGAPDKTVVAWTANSIKFDPGPNHPNGTAFKAGQLIQVGVLIGGVTSSNTLPYTF
jgi:hypothetical protein